MGSRVAALILVTGIAGCAMNAIRLDAAGEVVAASTTALDAADRYFDDLERRQVDAAAALVASDPSCLPTQTLRIQIPQRAAPVGARAPLCPPGDAAAEGYTVRMLEIGRSPRAILEPRVEVLAAVATYGAALATLLQAPGADVSAEIESFAVRLDGATRLLSLTTDGSLPAPSDAISTEVGRSVLALAEFGHDLTREAKDAARLHALVTERGGVVDEALARLRMEVETWATGADATASDLLGNALFLAYRQERATLTAAEREALAGRVFAARAVGADAARRAETVGAAIALAQEAQADLRRSLESPSEAQRRAAARLNLDRLLTALGLIADFADPL